MMEVYTLLGTWNTPDVEGAEVLGVWSRKEDAQRTMAEEAAAIRREFPVDFWQEDMTWEDDMEIHMAHDPMNLEPATIYCWTICRHEII